VVYQRLHSDHWEGVLRGLVEDHVAATDSRHGQRLLDNWEVERGRFWQICPKEMLDRLEHPLSDTPMAAAK
ncbi:MAG: hypothetical protein VCD33_07220, partial [Alphaproteobacteria bacterium]